MFLLDITGRRAQRAAAFPVSTCVAANRSGWSRAKFSFATVASARRTFVAILFACLLAGCVAGNGKGGCDAGCQQDHQITSAIESAMRERASLPDWDVQVQTEAGIVYLHGVDTIVQTDAIEAIARATPGVFGVQNAINLRAGSRQPSVSVAVVAPNCAYASDVRARQQLAASRPLLAALLRRRDRARRE